MNANVPRSEKARAEPVPLVRHDMSYKVHSDYIADIGYFLY